MEKKTIITSKHNWKQLHSLRVGNELKTMDATIKFLIDNLKPNVKWAFIPLIK